MLSEEEGYPVAVACELLGMARSTYYYPVRQLPEAEVKAAVEELAGRHPTYGRPRITHQLRREPYRLVVNHKRVGRIMRELGLQRPIKRRHVRTTNSNHPYPRFKNLVRDLVVTQPDEVWVSDVTYIRLGEGFVYLAIVLDVYTRAVRGWCLGRVLDQGLTLKALEQALQDRHPQIHHSDQGIQYAAQAYVETLRRHQIWISMAATGKPEENGYAERFMRTLKEEEVDLSEYRNFAEAQAQIKRFIEEVYMTKRIHSALRYLTPVEFEAGWKETHRS